MASSRRRPAFGELMQRIVDGGERHLLAGRRRFGVQNFRRDVAIARAEQQRSEREALARRPQSGAAQLLSQLGVHLQRGGLADAIAIVAERCLAVFRGCIAHLFNRLNGRDERCHPGNYGPRPRSTRV